MEILGSIGLSVLLLIVAGQIRGKYDGKNLPAAPPGGYWIGARAGMDHRPFLLGTAGNVAPALAGFAVARWLGLRERPQQYIAIRQMSVRGIHGRR